MRVVSKGSQKMIRWRLRVLMAEKNISNKELSELSGIHRVSISKLKNTDELKQITGEVLNNLCNGLTRAYYLRGDDTVINPGMLFDYSFDGNYPSPVVGTDRSSKSKKNSSKKPESSTENPITSSQTLLNVVPIKKKEIA